MWLRGALREMGRRCERNFKENSSFGEGGCAEECTSRVIRSSTCFEAAMVSREVQGRNPPLLCSFVAFYESLVA